jgi:hypothetical protein
MGTHEREGIAVASRRKSVDVGFVSAPGIGQVCPPCQDNRVYGAFQISSAYSAIVRSDENHPVLAVFKMDDRSQALRLRQAASILCCVVQ